RLSSWAREELTIVAIPVTLKAFSRIVFSFQLQKLLELRVARHELLGFGEFVIGQIITSAACYAQISQAAEGPRRRFDAFRRVECEQIENDARVRFFGPSQEALIIFFDQSNCTVDDYSVVRAQQFCRPRQKVRKVRAWHVNFGNDQARFVSAN